MALLIIIKKVVPSDVKGKITCVSFNEEKGYTAYDLSLSEISDWAIVVGWYPSMYGRSHNIHRYRHQRLNDKYSSITKFEVIAGAASSGAIIREVESTSASIAFIALTDTIFRTSL